MKDSNFRFLKNGVFHSIGILLLLSFFVFPIYNEWTSNDATIEVIELASDTEDEFTHCDPIFNTAYFFCPGNYSITGQLPSHCSFNWIGSTRCQGISTNVTYNGSSITISGSGVPGAFCKFRYSLSDTHGNTYYYLVGVRFYAEDSPECCINPPCI